MSNQRSTGYIVAGRYTLQKMLGEGGFGITYLAKDQQDIDKVLKECFRESVVYRKGDVVLPKVSKEGEWEAEKGYFKAEYERSYRVDHLNVVRIEDLVEYGGTYFMVMRYYEGKTLAEHLSEQENGRIGEKQALALLEGLVAGLVAIQEKGILHRDLKPENIILVKENDHSLRPIIIDLGAASEHGKPARPDGSPASPPYAAVEQECVSLLDEPDKSEGYYTDVYSLGAVAYKMLTGYHPNLASDRYKHGIPLNWSPDGPLEVSDVLKKWVEKAMSVKKQDRYADAKTMQKHFPKKTKEMDPTNINPINPKVEEKEENERRDPKKTWYSLPNWLRKFLFFGALFAVLAFVLRPALEYLWDYKSVVDEANWLQKSCQENGDKGNLDESYAAYEKAEKYLDWQEWITNLPLPYISGILSPNPDEMKDYRARIKLGQAKLFLDTEQGGHNCEVNIDEEKAYTLSREAEKIAEEVGANYEHKILPDVYRFGAALALKRKKADPVLAESYYAKLKESKQARIEDNIYAGALYWYWWAEGKGLVSKNDLYDKFVEPLKAEEDKYSEVLRETNKYGDLAYNNLVELKTAPDQERKKINAINTFFCALAGLETYHKQNRNKSKELCLQENISECSVCRE